MSQFKISVQNYENLHNYTYWKIWVYFSKIPPSDSYTIWDELEIFW